MGLATGCGALLLRGFAPAFTAPRRSEAPVATTVHQQCRLRSSVADGAASLATLAAAPAVVSGKPARRGVAAHFTVTLETPDGTQEFECPEDVYVLDQAEEGIELPYSCRAGSC